MNKRRLQVLEVFLRTRADKLDGKFDLCEWVSRDVAANLLPPGRQINFTTDQRKLDCGFAGCAIGWAATIPAFRRLGLKLTRAYTVAPVVTPSYDGVTSWKAVEAFFDISGNDAIKLFEYDSKSRNDPIAVADRIRNYIASHAQTGII